MTEADILQRDGGCVAKEGSDEDPGTEDERSSQLPVREDEATPQL